MAKEDLRVRLERERLFYQEVRNGVSQETHWNRGETAREVLHRYLMPTVTEPVRVLEVGAGLDAHALLCPIEPYRIAAALQAGQKDYTMAIVDINPVVIADIGQRQRVYCPRRIAPEAVQGWEEYLLEIDATPTPIHTPLPDLQFQDWVQPDYQAQMLQEGIFSAPIPSSFAQKLSRGELILQQGDIALTDLAALTQAPFDLINAENVLVYLRKTGQQLALDNFSRVLAPNGILVINDFELIMPYMESLFQNQFRGWLNPEVLREDFGLSIVAQHKAETKSTYLLTLAS